MDVGLIGVVFVGVVIGLYFVFVFTTAGHRKKQIEVFKAFLTDVNRISETLIGETRRSNEYLARIVAALETRH